MPELLSRDTNVKISLILLSISSFLDFAVTALFIQSIDQEGNEWARQFMEEMGMYSGLFIFVFVTSAILFAIYLLVLFLSGGLLGFTALSMIIFYSVVHLFGGLSWVLGFFPEVEILFTMFLGFLAVGFLADSVVFVLERAEG